MKLRPLPYLLSAICLVFAFPCHAGKIHDAVTKRDLAALDEALKRETDQVNSRYYPNFETPLAIAVGIGDPAIVKRLLDTGAEIMKPEVGLLRYNPLQLAAIAPCHLSHQATPNRDIQEQVQLFHHDRAKVMAALSETEKAARLEVLALMLAKKPELNKGFPSGNSPLHLAVCLGSAERVKLLINSGANVNARDSLWFTPLHIASIYQANQDLIDVLIAAGADVEASDKKGNTPLMLAARNGSKSAVEALLSHKASADAEDLERIPVIGAAAKKGHDDIVKLIYQKGGRDLLRFASKEVLFQCAAMGGSKALTDLLLAEEVDINIHDAAGFTPLLTASECRHWELSEYLILKGADRKAKTNDGRFLFDIVCQAGNTALAKQMLEADGWPQGSPELLSRIILAGRVEILRLLAERKVDILGIGPTFSGAGIGALQLAITGRDLTREDVAKIGNMNLVAAEEEYAQMIELLLEHGADVNQVSQNGSTAVHLAAKGCGSRVMKALLKAGGNYAIPMPNSKETPLQIATFLGRTETVQALLDAGADRNIRDPEGRTLMHLAAMSGNPETLQMLIATKTPVDVITPHDKITPLHCAAIVNSLESVRLLLDAGANPDARDATGWTPLAFAVDLSKSSMAFQKVDRFQVMIGDLKNRLSIIHLLLAAGARTDMTLTDKATGKESNLAEFASVNGAPEIVELLRHPPPVTRKVKKR